MLLDSIGKHVDLSKIDSQGNTDYIFPSNTIDDVYADENGVALATYLPTVTTNTSNVGAPVAVKQLGIVSVSSALYSAITTLPVVVAEP